MSEERPNVILFTTDQHRGDHLSIAGHPVVETPNVDSWVEEGAYFPNAYTEIPSTTGARVVLHTGKGSYHCGLIGYAGQEWDETTSVAHILAQAGYHCINVGWRNMHPRRKLYGYHLVIPHDLREGDDDYMEWLKREVGPWAHERGHGCDANGWLARPWHLEERHHPTVWTTEVALEQIAKRDPTKPFFLWCSHLRPHSPYDPPQFYWDMYINRELPEIPIGDWAGVHDKPNPGLSRTAWEGRLTPEQDQRGRAGYMGVITHIDYELGRMMEMLNRYLGGLANNTLWIFTSDHGDMMGDHHLHRKSYAFEGSARIPFVVKYPRGLDVPTGVFEQVVGLQDVMPTILDVCGVEAPEGVTGQSLLKAARGEPWREFFHGEHSQCYHPSNAMQYLTDGKEKYVWYPPTGEEQFFDISEDRRELRDLSKEPAHGERVTTWRERLIKLLGDRGDGFSDGEKLLIRNDNYGPIAQPPGQAGGE
jgi:arylsulfatase